MKNNNLTFAKHLGKVGISGMWVLKEENYANNRDTHEFHYYLGNQSICNTSELLTPKPKSYEIKYTTQLHNCCKVCCRLLVSGTKLSKINTQREKFLSLYSKQRVTLEDAVYNFITAENHDIKYSKVYEMFEKNFPEFSLKDVISFMIVHNQICLQDGLVLPIVVEKKEGEILS